MRQEMPLAGENVGGHAAGMAGADDQDVVFFRDHARGSFDKLSFY